jgi:hypothetical protein
MTTERARFTFGEGRIELEGSAEFVSAQIEKLQPILTKLSEYRPKTAAPATGADGQGEGVEDTRKVEQSGPSANGLAAYLNLFAVTQDGKIQILKSLPGNTKSAKSFAAAQLLTYANELRGLVNTSISDVRALCTAHACLDSGNFAGIFKTENGKSYFTQSSNGLALTHPGKMASRQLADAMNV